MGGLGRLGLKVFVKGPRQHPSVTRTLPGIPYRGSWEMSEGNSPQLPSWVVEYKVSGAVLTPPVQSDFPTCF